MQGWRRLVRYSTGISQRGGNANLHFSTPLNSWTTVLHHLCWPSTFLRKAAASLQYCEGICWGWPPTTVETDSLWDSWHREVVLDPLLETSPRPLCTCSSTTGVAAFNIEGHTLHSLLSLPVKGDFEELQGERLHQTQQSLVDMEYPIIDEMSMVGRKSSWPVSMSGVSPLSWYTVWRLLLLTHWRFWTATSSNGYPL